MSSTNDYSQLPPPPLRGSTVWSGVFGVPPPVEQDPPMYHYRGQSLTQPFDMVARMADKRPMLGAVLGLPSPDLARLMAGVGYDFVFLDWEHSPFGIREMSELIKTINYASEGHTAVIVRVPGFHHEYIGWALDAGASGILVPHTETAQQARDAVKAARFLHHNHGARSFPPFAVLPGINDASPDGQMPFDVWNKAAVIMQIESKLGCDNADEIAAVPGVNCLMIGVGDLCFDLNLGLEAMGGNPLLDGCIAKVIAASKKHDIPILGWATDASQVQAKLDQGYRIISIDSDAFTIPRVFRTNLAAARKVLKDNAEKNKSNGNAE